MVSDDVPCESDNIGKTEIPIRKFNLKRIDPSIPPPYTSHISYVKHNSGPAVQISTCTCSSFKEKAVDDVYVPQAQKALAYYNAKEHSNLSFVKVTIASYQCGPKNKVHLNFIANSEDCLEKLLFSEVVDGNVKGCCLLEKIESGNPIGWGCAMCDKEVIHPGPRHGHIITGGDLFQGYLFWGYRFPPRTSKATVDHNSMYFACAMKALDYFNSKQSTDFRGVEVVGGFTCPCPHKKIVHINFKCITSCESKQPLFFAELIVPSFTVDCGGWDIRKEKYISVKGCCLLEKVDSSNSFGRDCEICYCSEVIHPGPKDGYHVRVGDDFKGYGFMDRGLGVY